MNDPPLRYYFSIDLHRGVRLELPGNRGGRLEACDISSSTVQDPRTRRAAMRSLGIRQMCGATLWAANMAETTPSIERGVKCHGMHWECSRGLRTLGIAVERSGMRRARCIAIDKPLGMLEVCIDLEKQTKSTKLQGECEIKRSAGEHH